MLYQSSNRDHRHPLSARQEHIRLVADAKIIGAAADRLQHGGRIYRGIQRYVEVFLPKVALLLRDEHHLVAGNGDGIGDFIGLRQGLSYLAGLGISCIWLLPFYPSPGRDNGYDRIPGFINQCRFEWKQIHFVYRTEFCHSGINPT